MMKLAIIFLLFATIYNVHGLAVMSVDLGTEWMKIGIVSPGVPMEIALNKESKRKTPSIISFRDNVRSIGEDAQTVGIRFPKNAYGYLLDLLAKDINHPLVKLYQERFPYYDIVEDTETGTILFRHDEQTLYRPEELIAQLLAKAKEFAEQSAHQRIKECVLTVPGYFNQAERRALLQAAELANLKVLQLINDHMAVALNYGIFRSKDFNETSQYVMFYDMGASSTTASLVSYQTVKTKERGYAETHPQATIIGFGYDRTLGGLEMQIRLQKFLAQKFNDLKKTKNDVFQNPRAMAKLFKEAGRLKNILSANAEHYAQIEGLLDEQDFKLLVTRDEFEQLFGDLLERVGGPVERALKSAGLSRDVINQVVLVGAGTRVPKVQEYLQKVVGQDLAKNLNTDEAATMGAVYKAADLSSGFQVKKFITKDAIIFPIQVLFEREAEGTVRTVKRTLFGLMNPYPQKKIITFNKHTDDFSFHVNYAELDHLPENEVASIGPLNITVVSLEGVAEALRKHTGENSETKGIKAHFAMDDSGVLTLQNVELAVEKTVSPDAEEESPLSKLGSTITKLFTGEGETVKPTEEKPPVQEESESSKSDEKPEESAPKNGTETNKTETTKEPEKKDTKPKVVSFKEPIKSTEKFLSINQLTKSQFEESVKKLDALNTVDKELTRRATALNNLESFVIDVQNKLYEPEYSEATTEGEREKIQKLCSETSDWLYEDGADADADTYESKLNDLKDLTRDLYYRVFEHKERPEALNALNNMLNGSRHFLTHSKNMTKETNAEKDIFTNVEVETLEKLIVDTEEWRDGQVKEQEKVKKFEPVKLTVKAISEKMSLLDREVKYMVNKMKLWKPKKTEKVKEKKEETEAEKETAEEAPEADSEAEIELEPSKTQDDPDSHTEL